VEIVNKNKKNRGKSNFGKKRETPFVFRSVSYSSSLLSEEFVCQLCVKNVCVCLYFIRWKWKFFQTNIIFYSRAVDCQNSRSVPDCTLFARSRLFISKVTYFHFIELEYSFRVEYFIFITACGGGVVPIDVILLFCALFYRKMKSYFMTLS
jgi:hypothetical protein